MYRHLEANVEAHGAKFSIGLEVDVDYTIKRGWGATWDQPADGDEAEVTGISICGVHWDGEECPAEAAAVLHALRNTTQHSMDDLLPADWTHDLMDDDQLVEEIHEHEAAN